MLDFGDFDFGSTGCIDPIDRQPLIVAEAVEMLRCEEASVVDRAAMIGNAEECVLFFGLI